MSALHDFFSAPSESLLLALTKEQLFNVADHYMIGLTLSKSAKKEQIVDFIREHLKDKQVLPRNIPLETSSTGLSFPVIPVAASMSSPDSGLTFEQHKELLRMQLEHKTQESEKDRLLELQKLKLQEQDKEIERFRLKLVADGKFSSSGSGEKSGLAGMIKFLPKFNERDPDVFFSLFENVASDREWDDEDKILLLQTVLVGKAQEAFVALPTTERKNYQCVKDAVLKCYELIPEAYRQRFRNWRKSDRQTHAEIARELSSFFHRWCTAEGISNFDDLCDLVILEQFKNILPERIATYVGEHQVRTAAQAAVLADNFVLMHKNPMREHPPRHEYSRREHRPGRPNTGPFNAGFFWRPDSTRNRVRDMDADNKCHYCLEMGHWKKECPMLSARNKSKAGSSKPVGCASSVFATKLQHCVGSQEALLTAPDRQQTNVQVGKIDGDKTAVSDVVDYTPFITEGFVSLVDDAQKVPVRILRDTGASESFISESVLPFSSVSNTGNVVLIRGIDLQPFSVPLHKIQLSSAFCNGEVTIAVRPSLPIDGVELILGNNLGGGRVWPEGSLPPPVVRRDVVPSAESDKNLQDFPEVFTACAVTRAMSRAQSEKPSDASKTKLKLYIPELPASLSRSEMIDAQKDDLGLRKYFDLASDLSMDNNYCVQNGLLLRRWSPFATLEVADPVLQVVVPEKYRNLVLKTAHGEMTGHYGVKKTYSHLLQHFYWPRIKRDVAKFIKECHICQIAGKPNVSIKPAPLHPIPSVGTPFEHLIIDCVGPLPASKSGCLYLFTIMCQATRYPAAYALRSITTKSIIKSLSHFISIFGIPKVIQSDRGSNFTSRTFAEALKQLRIKHNLSSAYHAQSQGALERFHATLKSLLRAYCVEMERDWEEGLPWLLLAARSVVQESTGFSPNELVFAHKVRSSLSVLSSDLDNSEPPESLTEYTNGFRRKLFLAWKMASSNLTEAQQKMKRIYDRKAETREFSPGDQVVALLPIPGSPFRAKYSGPYSVVRRVSALNYLVSTPERRRSTQLCHINLLKPYYSPTLSVGGDKVDMKPVGLAVIKEVLSTSQVAAEDGVQGPDDAVLHGRLNNTESLAKLDSLLTHLEGRQREQLKSLIFEFSSLFSDIPTCTSLIEHDIDVGDAQPIRQRFYRVSPDKHKSLEDSVRYLLDNGLAKPSYSSWASPCLLVKKPDNTFRFCTDYRKVNMVTKPDSFPLPRMEDCVDQVGAACFVSKFDLLKGYYQVPLTPRAQEISSFITPSGLYSYNRMSFGLRNAPSTFQRLMNRVVVGLEGCAVYLDDVVSYADTWEQHLARIRALFEKLVAANLTVNLAKCEFAQATVVYLGKVVGQGQVRLVRAKVLAIDKFPPPTTKKELMRFLGMIGYYRNFCCNFSTVVSPLTNLLKSSVKFDWSPECQQAFENAKLLLSSAPVLAAPQLDQPFQIQVDASQVGAGAILLQRDKNGVDRPVCYFSRKFNRHQSNYSTIEKEALALIWALQNFDVYVGGGLHPVVVYSDHNPLTFLHSLQNANQRLMRWALFLQPYRLSIRHIKGVENVMADALSRAPEGS